MSVGDAAVSVDPGAACNVAVVAIGASAGGVAALPVVVSALAADFPAAVIIVLHVGQRSDSMLARLLGRVSQLPVRDAIDGETVEPAVIYVAPPGTHLVLRGGTLVLTNSAPVHFVRPSVDVLFASVAAACGPRAIGVILTGTGVDGADGLRALKAAGGMTIVQKPSTAEHKGMPMAAFQTGSVDHSLMLADIGPALGHMVSRPPSPAARPSSAASRAGDTPSALQVQRSLEAMPAAVMVVDASDTILVWNALAESMFETPVPNALGRKFRDLDVSYRVEGLRARVEDVKARQTGARLADITFTRHNGEIVHANVTIAPLFDGHRLIGVLVSFEDATEYARLKEQMTRIAEQHATAIEELQSTNEELKTTNEELQSTNEELETTVEELQAANAELAALNSELEDCGAELARLDSYHRAVADGMDAAIIVLDRAGVVRTWSQAAERMWGLRSDQVLGRELLTLPLGELVRVARPALQRVVASGLAEPPLTVSYPDADGGQHPASLRITAVHDGNGAVVGGVAIASPTGR